MPSRPGSSSRSDSEWPSTHVSRSSASRRRTRLPAVRASSRERLIRVIPGSRAAGPARTASCAPGDNLAAHRALARLESGEVLVLAVTEPRPVAVIGELIALQAKVRGGGGELRPRLGRADPGCPSTPGSPAAGSSRAAARAEGVAWMSSVSRSASPANAATRLPLICVISAGSTSRRVAVGNRAHPRARDARPPAVPRRPRSLASGSTARRRPCSPRKERPCGPAGARPAVGGPAIGRMPALRLSALEQARRAAPPCASCALFPPRAGPSRGRRASASSDRNRRGS